MRQACHTITVDTREKGLSTSTPHARAALTQTHLAIPVAGGVPLLGTWQGLYVFEHRRHAQTRSVVLHLVGEQGGCGILQRFPSRGPPCFRLNS